MTFFDRFEAVYVISLSDRADRRKALNRELKKSFDGASIDSIGEVFDACRPEDPAGFPTTSIRGCFESHLNVLRSAQDRGVDSVLILEDDVAFPAAVVNQLEESARQLDTIEWHSATFGCADSWGHLAKHVGDRTDYHWTRFSGEVQQAHCVAFTREGIDRTVVHLEKLFNGTPGDRLRGPMHVDGAYNVQTWSDPTFVRMMLTPPLIPQRVSRSDISPTRLDGVGTLRPVITAVRDLREQLRHRRQGA
ncbi:MAG: glycosyltransferase family 25 protein [Acidimicrobiales bacterium]